MIDPQKVINYNRTEYELQEFLLFTVCVAGKTAKQISKALSKFLHLAPMYLEAHYWQTPEVYQDIDKSTPFSLIKELIKTNQLRKLIQDSSLGQFNKLEKAFIELSNSNFDLKNVTVEQLETIHGIGPKTAR